VSLGYQLGAIVGGAFAPTIATALWRESTIGIFGVSIYIAFASIGTIASVMLLTETFQSSLHEA
jgi:glycerol uptake facilitator-like aquaporin